MLQPHPHLAANFKGHTDTVLSLSFEPNGKYLASSSKGMCIVYVFLLVTGITVTLRGMVLMGAHNNHTSLITMSVYVVNLNTFSF